MSGRRPRIVVNALSARGGGGVTSGEQEIPNAGLPQHGLVITWTPEHLSASFHGRDVFAPVAARLARGEAPPGEPVQRDTVDRADWPDELARIVYVDRYGNAVSGHRADGIPTTAKLRAGGREVAHSETFSGVPPGSAFWYANSNGLIEIAVNQGRADTELGLGVGDPIAIGDNLV